MKKLVKVRIINWHYFYNTTFTVDQVNFLTGQNAAGKSTLIDAMQVVLLGDTSGRQFNKAASEKAGRTLKGYLKGKKWILKRFITDTYMGQEETILSMNMTVFRSNWYHLIALTSHHFV